MTTTEAPAVVHDLKVLPAFFEALRDGRKTYEVRRLDRPYAVGDTLALHEWGATHDYPDGRYTGREVRKRISHMLAGSPWMPDGIAVLGLEPPGYAATLGELRAALAMERDAFHLQRARAEKAEADLATERARAHAQREAESNRRAIVSGCLDEACMRAGFARSGETFRDIRSLGATVERMLELAQETLSKGAAHAKLQIKAEARIVELEGLLVEEQEARASWANRALVAEFNDGGARADLIAERSLHREDRLSLLAARDLGRARVRQLVLALDPEGDFEVDEESSPTELYESATRALDRMITSEVEATRRSLPFEPAPTAPAGLPVPDDVAADLMAAPPFMTKHVVLPPLDTWPKTPEECARARGVPIPHPEVAGMRVVADPTVPPGEVHIVGSGGATRITGFGECIAVADDDGEPG